MHEWKLLGRTGEKALRNLVRNVSEPEKGGLGAVGLLGPWKGLVSWSSCRGVGSRAGAEGGLKESQELLGPPGAHSSLTCAGQESGYQ